MNRGKIVDINCQCGFHLFRYFKVGKGTIIKCIISRIHEDFVGLKGAETFSKPLCPNCGKELGIIKIIHGEPALKLNNGTIKKVRL